MESSFSTRRRDAEIRPSTSDGRVAALEIRCIQPSIVSFGSSTTGTGAPAADIDANITLDRLRHLERGVFDDLKGAVEHLALNRDVLVLSRIKVPINKFQLIPELGELGVDITIQKSDGPTGTAALKRLLGEMAALRPLTILIKSRLAKTEKLGKPKEGGIAGFNIIILIALYLQQ
ncbi:hypothetical protein A4X13_0g7754 [Tilletia indica]|uniref:Uncharacterized protein n=1 Tax=Tilletia indica TaxID=43049 RepID=A0A177T5I4_9BASI|nr:hypothetical protein A4X13_0g7754 [Tilletia indica]